MTPKLSSLCFLKNNPSTCVQSSSTPGLSPPCPCAAGPGVAVPPFQARGACGPVGLEESQLQRELTKGSVVSACNRCHAALLMH